jgi:hypothetical protein
LKKRLKLKDLVTVPEAATHLSTIFDEEITEADILRFALDGRLTLSVEFVTFAACNPGKIISISEEEKKLTFSDGRRFISGVWDLAMVGGEVWEIKRKYHLLTGGPDVDIGVSGYSLIRTLTGDSNVLDGLLVNRPDGTWGQLLVLKEAGGYDLAEALPSDAVLVVRTSALHDLEAHISEPDTPLQRPLGRRERDTLLVIIGALAKLARIDVAKPTKAAGIIEGETTRMGSRVAARTIEDHLKRIPDALERKGDED